MPANGSWHEWTFNYDVKVENNEVHLDIAEREAKILVFSGENWQQPAPEPTTAQPTDASQKQQPDPPADQKPQPTQSETPSQ